ncbi:helix-turn-helix domain-containing protein [Paenibacillus solisilvae]|uniref:Helix-turn-helix domain-containing protein n=1 Tax=Paenibacillus solisilvae TaxID=2486751 RepID=A0ABW0VT62_9BACL
MDRSAPLNLKENRVHGHSLLPIAVYEVQCNAGEKGFDLHWHKEAEWLMVVQGEVLFQIDTEYFTVQAGEALYVDSGDIHAALEASRTSSAVFYAIVLDLNWLSSSSFDTVQRNYISPLQEKTKTFPRHIRPYSDWEKQLLTHLVHLVQTFEKQTPGYDIRMKALLLLMLSELSAEEGRACDRSEAVLADNTKVERLKTVILYMHNHYQHKITISRLAALIPMSEGQFNRFFKAMTRTTPIDYLNAYRINKAAEQLLLSDRNISTVAMDVGFDNLSYFIKVFRRMMKCSPSEFRKANSGSAGWNGMTFMT